MRSREVSSRHRFTWCLPTLAVLVLVTACTSPVTERSALSLKGNMGLVAFDFNTAVEGDYQVRLSGAFGKVLKMDNVPAGESIYLYKFSPGKYCISALYLTGSDKLLEFAGKSPCFMVSAGKLTYAGTLSNSTYRFYVIDYDGFINSLKSAYPQVYNRYVLGAGSVNQPST